MAEANAAGVPVIAMDLGSCREVVEDGQTGFLVSNPDQAVQALGRLAEIDRRACRHRVERRFSIASMVAAYEACLRNDLRAGGEEATMTHQTVLIWRAPLPFDANSGVEDPQMTRLQRGPISHE